MKKAACYSLWVVLAALAAGAALGMLVLPGLFKKKLVPKV